MKKYKIIFHVICPIILGIILYYLISPDVYFIQKIDGLLGVNKHTVRFYTDHIMYQFVRNYLLDMLWAYSLTFCIYWVLGNNTAPLLKTIMIAFAFSSFMELLQLTPIVNGTFDVYDIMAELIAEVIAVFIIKLQLRRILHYEKKN